MKRQRGKSGFGIGTLIALVVGNAIGAGIYTTSGFALADLGSREWVMAAWLIGGLVALTGAISYGMLARGLAESGGEYLYLSRHLHPAAGFVAGWISMLAGFTGAIAFAATALETYAVSAYAPLGTIGGDVIAISVVVFGGIIHAVKSGAGAAIHDFFVSIMIAVLIGLVLFAAIQFVGGSWDIAPASHYDAEFKLTAFAGTLVWISLSYSGFNAAVYVAGEAIDPERSVPRAMIFGTILMIALYMALNAVFLYAPLPENIAGQPEVAAIAAEAVGGSVFRRVIEGIVAISLLTSVTAMVMAGPRVYAKMADDGALPSLFRLRDGTPPRAAIILQVILAVMVVLVADLQGLLSYLGFTLSLCLALAVSTLFVRHLRSGEHPQHWAYPVAPILFVGATLLFAALSAWRDPIQLFVGAATVAVGLIAYALARKSSVFNPRMSAAEFDPPSQQEGVLHHADKPDA